MKKIISLFMIFCVLSVESPAGVLATDGNVYSGYCGAEGDGTNIQWQYDTETQTLTFTGSGAMKDWRHKTAFDDEYDPTAEYDETPWKKYGYCEQIKHAVISDGITVMGNFALSSCTGLEDVYLGKDLTNIGVGGFEGCSSLSAIEVPSEVEFLGVGAFYSCTSLVDVSLPEGLQTIYYGAFAMCESLETLQIPTTVTQINAGVFALCMSLQELIIPENVQGVSAYTFYYCFSLNSITFLGDLKYINSSAFFSCISLEEFKIPDTCTSIAEDAFDECSFLTLKCYEGSHGESFCRQYAPGSYEVITHDFREDSIIVPTCTEQGYTLQYCAECDRFRKQNYTDALGHEIGEWSIAEVATPDADGKLICSCSRCDWRSEKTYPYHTPGDTDLDEELTVYDVILILQQIAGITEFNEYALSAGDLNLNYTIDTYDATLLLNRVCGLEVEFPSENLS